MNQAKGNPDNLLPSLIQVYWADFGHDETKAVGELRAMPRQFVGPWIQASRVSLAGLEGLTASSAAPHVFRELTEGKLLTCKFRGKDQPVGGVTRTGRLR